MTAPRTISLPDFYLHFNPKHGEIVAVFKGHKLVMPQALWANLILLLESRMKLARWLDGRGVAEGVSAEIASYNRFIADLERAFQGCVARLPHGTLVVFALLYSRLHCHLVFQSIRKKGALIKEVTILSQHLKGKGGMISSTVHGSASTIRARKCLRLAPPGFRNTTAPQCPPRQRKKVAGVNCVVAG